MCVQPRARSASLGDTGWHDGNLEQRDDAIVLHEPLVSLSLFPVSSSSLESRLLPWQHRYETLKNPAKAERREREENEKIPLVFSAVSRYPSFFSFLVCSASSSLSIRCLKKSIRLSPRTRRLVPASSSLSSIRSLSRLWYSSLFASYIERRATTMRGDPSRGDKGDRMTREG